jgi:NADPH-dependent curcumin reductase CurA
MCPDELARNHDASSQIIVVGLISTYDHDDTAWQINFKPILANGLTVQGYSPFHYAEHFGEATGDLLAWVTAGDITPWKPSSTDSTPSRRLTPICSPAPTPAR